MSWKTAYLKDAKIIMPCKITISVESTNTPAVFEDFHCDDLQRVDFYTGTRPGNKKPNPKRLLCSANRMCTYNYYTGVIEKTGTVGHCIFVDKNNEILNISNVAMAGAKLTLGDIRFAKGDLITINKTEFGKSLPDLTKRHAYDG
ncbi:MAG: hypothetical protein GY820_39025 [Gammaproteobacteria bacterium]|nr:hypothetical protein [Gammaproteobacteria bacterium]